MWDRAGEKIKGLYLGAFEFEGVIASSRVKYGGKVSHFVRLDKPIEVMGVMRDYLLIDELSTMEKV